MSPRIAIVTAGLIAGLAVAHPVAAEPGPAPSRLMEAGLAAYRAGDYGAAIAAFRAAHVADGRPSALFAMAQAERMSGDCAAAVADYDRFLATRPTERQADAAREMRARCASDAPAAGTAPAPAPVAAVPSGPAPRAVAVPAGPAPWYHDGVTDGLVVGAGVLAASALGFSLAATAPPPTRRPPTPTPPTPPRPTGPREIASSARSAWPAPRCSAGSQPGASSTTARPERTIAVAPGPGVGLALVGSFW